MIKKTSLPLVIITLCFFVNACTDPDIIGLQVQPNGEKLGVDTAFTSLETYTVLEDSLPTTNNSYNLLGSYTDPIFGYSNASIYSQLSMANNDISFNNTPVVDSIVLRIAYRGYYGKTANTQTLKIFKLTQTLLDTSYSDKVYTYDNAAIATLPFVPKPTDSVIVGTKKHSPQLRVALDKAFGESILNGKGAGKPLTNEDFIKAVNGLYFRMDKNMAEGAILYFDLLSSESNISLYYHDGTVASIAKFNFGSKRIGHFEHDYTGTNILSTSNQSQDYSYVQAMAGVKTKIVLPNIAALRQKGRILINKAVLVISAIAEDTSYSPPSKLFVLKKDAAGHIAAITDQYEGSNYYDGNYNSTVKQYKFNIARHVQELLYETVTDNNLYLTAPVAVITGNRVVIGGGRNTNDKLRMKLHITYTKIN